MVSKVAVIALVAIVACPILLGYAMNLYEITETEYKTAGDSINVTPLLQNDVRYIDVQADTNVINSGFGYVNNSNPNTHYPIYPVYEGQSSVKSSLPLTEFNNSLANGGSAGVNLASYNMFYILFNYTVSSGRATITVYHNSTVTNTLTNVAEIYYYRTSDSITYSTYGGTVASISGGDYTSFNVTNTTGQDIGLHNGYQPISSPTSFIDISAGLHFTDKTFGNFDPGIVLPGHSSSIVLSINLDSITAANYSVIVTFNPSGTGAIPSLRLLKLVKTTTGGEVSWQYGTSGVNLNPPLYDLYYDPSRNDNTYQVAFSIDEPYPYGSNSNRYDNHLELRYIGGWSNFIGVANAYMIYSSDGASSLVNPNSISGISSVSFSNISGSNRTPTVRMDSDFIKGFEQPVISNKTYSPATFRSNPSTTFDAINLYGQSITFGGNTYTVDSTGNITLGTHKVSLKGIVFDSVLVSGSYDNRINGVVISNTAQPSDIIFNGSWDVSVSTQSMESTTYTKTEWTPGQFGWNGIDHNFLIVGLITSLGAFIGIGIYARRTKTGLWPLLIVCGCAAVLFFIML